MAERIELPPTLQGDEKAQLQQLWSYLYQTSEALNSNLQAIGGNELTDSERKVMQQILAGDGEGINSSEMETLKSLIIKTADFVQTSVQEWRMNLLGESVASGQFGRYVRHTGLDVEVTPEGITQNYSFEEVVQGLKEFSVNAKNYIKTGLLRTVSSIPVYGVAIGKDVVTFAEDGTETYNDGNKVAELTADELSFWQGGSKIASYKGNRISFFYGADEVFYISQGKLYCNNDMEITSGKTLTIKAGSDTWTFNTNGLKYVDSDSQFPFQLTSYSDKESDTVGLFTKYESNKGKLIFVSGTKIGNTNKFAQIELSTEDYNNTYDPANGIYIINGHGTVMNPLNGYSVLGDASNPWLSANIMGIMLSNIVGLNATMRPGYDNMIKMWPGGVDDGHFLQNIVFKKTTSGSSEYRDITSDDMTTLRYYGLTMGVSSRYVKNNIRPLEDRGEIIDKLEPVSFKYNKDQSGRIHFGLIYEDTVGLIPEICMEDTEQKAINYVELIPVLLKEIQDLRRRVSELEGGR